MTISELGSIGEFLGSIVVVVSVLYLAYQLKQTQAAITLNALQSRASGQIAEATSETTGPIEDVVRADSNSAIRIIHALP